MKVRLTPKGRLQFDEMAATHKRWINELLADIDEEAAEALIAHFDSVPLKSVSQ
jgi:DNA-binding MarR family transcriptional regulator